MKKDPVIKTYYDNAENTQELEKPAQRNKAPESQVNSVDERKAFVVGLVTIIVIIAIIVLMVIFGAMKNGSDTVTEFSEEKAAGIEQQDSPAIMGAQDEQPVIIDAEADNSSEDQKSKEETKPELSGETYIVEAGESLYAIGTKLKIDWQELAEINGIEAPYALKTGQKLVLPKN